MPVRGHNSRIAIAGAGMVGAYLYRHLRNRGHEVDIFDVKQPTRCGMTPCAWGTSKEFTELVEAVGLNPHTYTIRRFDHLFMDDIKIKADLWTFDKPRLIKDLLGHAETKYSRLHVEDYDRVFDATGVSRVILPAIEHDVVLGCVQYLVETDEQLDNRIKLGGIGYAWCFPLSDNVYHIGCGSLIGDPSLRLMKFGWLGINPSEPSMNTVCGCKGGVRLTGPHASLPFVSEGAVEGVWGVGEAIGCVAPLAGDGVVTGMRSVQVLLRHWDDPNGYTEGILKEFSWMKSERNVVDKLIKGQSLGMEDAWVLRKNSKRMGMQVGTREALTLMKNLMWWQS